MGEPPFIMGLRDGASGEPGLGERALVGECLPSAAVLKRSNRGERRAGASSLPSIGISRAPPSGCCVASEEAAADALRCHAMKFSTASLRLGAPGAELALPALHAATWPARLRVAAPPAL